MRLAKHSLHLPAHACSYIDQVLFNSLFLHSSLSRSIAPHLIPEAKMSAFGSIPLIFIVDGHEYFVHADLLFEHSAPLYTMITTSGMRESQEKVATLDGVSRKTFERFLEWVYKGFYTAAEPIEEAAPELPAPPDPEVEVFLRPTALVKSLD